MISSPPPPLWTKFRIGPLETAVDTESVDEGGTAERVHRSICFADGFWSRTDFE